MGMIHKIENICDFILYLVTTSIVSQIKVMLTVFQALLWACQ
jgi:hypothetical protein